VSQETLQGGGTTGVVERLRAWTAWGRGRERDVAAWFFSMAVALFFGAALLVEALLDSSDLRRILSFEFAAMAALAAVNVVLAWAIPRLSPAGVRALRHVLLLSLTAAVFLWGPDPEHQVHAYMTALAVIGLAPFLTSPWGVVGYVTAVAAAVFALEWPAGLGELNLGTVLVSGLGVIVAAFIFAHAQNLARQRAAVLEESANVLERRVTERTQQLRDFIAAISHELRAPLANIRAYAENELEGGAWTAPESRQSLEIILDEAGVLAEHVNNLLVAAQIDADVLQPHLETLAVDEAAAEVVAALRGRFRLAQRCLQVEVSPELPPVIADLRFVKIVLTNLLDNAHKYSPPGEPIALRGEHEEPWVVLAVHNRGPGIAPEERERVFERYWRGRGAGGKIGLGLGLSICRELARRQGGDVDVDGAAGDGTVFRLRLPRAPVDAL
jgi:signal transduction histidine kinase